MVDVGVDVDASAMLTHDTSKLGQRNRANVKFTEQTWRQAFISCTLGSLIAALVVMAMARPGVMYHIG